MELFFTQVGNFGFPIVLSLYLLMRMEKKLDRLTESIGQLAQAVNLGVMGKPPGGD